MEKGSDSLKIIQLIQRPQLRGAETFAQQLSEELERRGHQSVIVTVFDSNKNEPFRGVVHALNGSQARRLWDWRAWKKLAKIISLEKPDLIQANAGDTLKYAVFSKLVFGWKTPIVFRNASTISQYIKSPFSKWWNSFLLRFTKYIISVSEFSKKDFIKKFPESEKKISVVPIGVAIHNSDPVEVSHYTEDPIFLHIGGFTFEKNHYGLISIFERIKSRFPKASLGLVGDGPLKDGLELLVASRGLHQSIRFYGFQKNPEKYLQNAKCLLLPSIIEGLPAVVLEAFLHKVPVVAYDVGGISEIVKPNETGWLVKKNDEEGFFKAVCEVIENEVKVKSLTEAAYNLVGNGFSLREVAGKFITTYNQILRMPKVL